MRDNTPVVNAESQLTVNIGYTL